MTTTNTIYLSGVANPVLEPHAGREDLGLMVGPGGGTYSKIPTYGAFGADNGCFAKGDKFDPAEWLTFLDRLPRSGALFAVAPDVVGNASATLERARPWLPIVRSKGFPVAYVAQDGLTSASELPWEEFDVIFIGGSTEFKLSPLALSLAREAKVRGKGSHMGRVNSARRFRIAQRAGFDSVDGTFLAFGPSANLPRLLSWLDEAPAAA